MAVSSQRLITVAILVVGLFFTLIPAGAQQPARAPRLGLLTWERCPTPTSVFGRALKDLGYTWGQTMEVLCRSADGDYERLSSAADALAAENVDVIAALTHITAYAAHRATRSIPIVMMASGDPVASGLAGSLAHPGGNVTGLTYYAAELVEKRLELLKEIIPAATRIAIIDNSQSDYVFGLYRMDAERAARALGLQLVKVDVREASHLERSFDIIVKSGAQGLLVMPDPVLRDQARPIAELAARHRIPAMYWGPWFVEAGGLAAYSADYDGMVRRAAYYVDRILKGARPADLPIEQPTMFELVINLKAARALGLTIPDALLARADRLIED